MNCKKKTYFNFPPKELVSEFKKHMDTLKIDVLEV